MFLRRSGFFEFMNMKIVGFVFVFLIGFVFAAQPFPHDFEGFIVSEDGTSSNVKTLIVSVDGAVTGTTKIVNGYYRVTALDNMGYGGDVEFFIGDEEAREVFSFEKFGDSIVNLTFSTIPDLPGEGVGFCGDDVCAVGECSFCAIDCPVSLCLGNGECDAAIGEDYVTAPTDCVSCGDGVCNGVESCSSCSGDCGACDSGSGSDGGSSSSGGSGGGSGSGGGFGVESEDINSSSNESQEKKVFGTTSIEDLNTVSSESKPEETEGFSSLITGAVIGSGPNSWMTAFVLIALVLGVFFFLKGRGSFVKAQKVSDSKKKTKKKTNRTKRKSAKKKVSNK